MLGKMDNGESGTSWLWCDFGWSGRSSLEILSDMLLTSVQWPYSYDSCDVGTLPNQTYPGQNLPLAATENGDPLYGGVLVDHLFRSLAAFV